VVPNGGVATDNTGYVAPPAECGQTDGLVYGSMATTNSSCGQVAGIVYIDKNNNGVYDAGDTPLPGVDVVITDSGGNVLTVTTDGSGFYSAIVPSGNTTVDVDNADLPPGVVLASGSTDWTIVNVPAGGTATDNTGYRLPANTGLVNGYVYDDVNGNGLYELGIDTPLVGVPS